MSTPAKSEIRPAVPAIALPAPAAAAALGMGESAFREYAAPELRVIRCGRLRLYPVADLIRWADANAERVLERAA